MLSDGSLVCRAGVRKLCEIGARIQAVWSGRIGDYFYCYFLSNGRVYMYNESTGERLTILCDTPLGERGEFFYYRGALYLVDGIGLYRVDERTLSVPHGYVPLVARNWSDNELGEIYEPHNLLCNKGRLTYTVSAQASTILRLDDFVSSVDALYINGELASADRYTLGVNSPFVTVIGLAEGDRCELYVTYRETYGDALARLKSCKRAYVFGGADSSRPFLYDASERSMLFPAGYVSEEGLMAARRVYAESDALYFPMGNEFSVGDGRYPISTLLRHYDRLLIFTEGGVWRAESGDGYSPERLPIMNVNTATDTPSPYGAALLGNNPYSVGRGAVYRWRANTDELNDCNAYVISEALGEQLGDAFCKGVFVYADKRKNEVYFTSPSADSRIWVYSEASESWSTFDGIAAEKFFDTEEGCGFISGTSVYCFDDSLTLDDGAVIENALELYSSELGTPDKKSLCAVASSFDGGISCTLRLDGEDRDYMSFALTGESGKHYYRKKRVHTRRFSSVSARLSLSDARGSIHSLELYVR